MEPTTVVNIRHQNYDVYIGRKGHGHDGYFGNPIKPMTWCQVCGHAHNRGETLDCYKSYFLDRVTKDREFRARVEALKGKRLGCFCKPKKRCHGDTIAAYLNGDLLP